MVDLRPDGGSELFDAWLRRCPDAVGLLRAQSLGVLRTLFSNRSQIVTKQTLFDAVWGAHIVTDDSLVQCIGEIRRAIGGDERIVVQTHPRRGYLLELSEEARPDDRHPAVLPSIAVFPFDCVGGQRERVIAHGMTEDLTTELSRHKEFHVLAHHTIRSLDESDDPSEDIASRLGVRYVLRGSVQQRLDSIVVNVHVTDMRDRTLVWSERYVESDDDVFAAQDRVVVAVVNRLGNGAGVVVSTERRHFGATGSAALDAYDHYILGSDVARYFSADGSANAVMHLERAVRADPLFSKAWSRLAILYLVRLSYTYTDDFEGTAQRMIGAAMRAVDADPTDSFAHVIAGGAWFQAGDVRRGRESFERALANGPSNADTLAALAYIRPTKLPTATEDLRHVRRAMALSPFHPPWYSLAFGYCGYYAREFREATHQLARVEDDVLDKHLYRTLCFAELGDIEPMQASRARLLAMQPAMHLQALIAGDGMHDAGAVQQLGHSFELAGLPL